VYEQPRAYRLHISSHRRPLLTDTVEVSNQALLSVLASTSRDELLVLQWVLGHRLRPVAIPNQFEDFTYESWWHRLAAALLGPPGRVDVEFRNALRAKQSVPGWRVIGRIGVQAGDRQRRRQILAQLVSALRVAEGPNVKLGVSRSRQSSLVEARRPWLWPSVLNSGELLGLLAWPVGEHDFPMVRRRLSRFLPAVSRIPRRGRVVAESLSSEAQRALCLNPMDALHHLWTVGPTGTGKSTLLLNLIVQDMAAGRAIAVVEPKGDLIEAVLERVPAHRRDDVVVLDPGDQTRPVGFNPLARSDGTPSPLVVDEVLAVFRGLYGAALGPRSSDILHAGLLTLTADERATLPLLPLLFSNDSWRRQLAARLGDPLGVGSFWAWWDGINPGERHAALAPLMNKLRPFLLRPAMVGVIGQAQPRFELRKLFDRRQILLINLSQGKLGSEAAQLFGSLVVSGLWRTIRARERLSPSRRAPAFVYVDEAPQYLHLPVDLADMLVQSRGFGVGLNLASQHVSQFPPELRAAVLANARSQVAFQLAGDDAAVLARDSRLITAEDFTNLERYEVYARLVAGGQRTPWASARTLSPTKPSSRPGELRSHSRARWGVDRQTIETTLREQLAGANRVTEPRIGRRSRADDSRGGQA
jgi:hypothetical protein